MNVILELFNDARTAFQFRQKSHRWQVQQDRLAPKTGELAPDFTLFDITGTASVTLSDFRGKKPVVLVFGSYT